MDIKLQNTLSGQKEKFTPIREGEVKMYNCGPTVYGPQHIGNLSMFVFTDILRRTLDYFGYEVKQVINFTDMGHLSSDADEGEDKMTNGLKRDGLEINLLNMLNLGSRYAQIFLDDLEKLNINIKKILFPFASSFIEDQWKLIERLEEKRFTYRTSDGIYFDTSKFPDYGKLGHINPASVEASAGRARIEENKEKKNQKDFALWKFSTNLGWDSKWGKGFPGWHIECTAMIFALLGEQIDIHTGGIEHIGVHHNNEIAQAEAVSGKSPFSRFWLHREHVKMNDEKIAKSTSNVLYLEDLIKKGIHPMSYRYWLLTSRYNTPSNFTWEAVTGAQTALEKIVSEYGAEELSEGVFSERKIAKLPKESSSTKEIIQKFEGAIADDLNTPVAIALLNKAVEEKVSREIIDKIDEVLGLNIAELAKQMQNIPETILALQKQRCEARQNENWKLSDQIRNQIESLGYIIQDNPQNSLILRSISSLAQI